MKGGGGEGGGGGGGGGFVVQDMLSKGSGEHVLRSPYSGGSDHLRRGGDPVWRVDGWHWRREAPCPVRHILGSWCRRSLILAGFSPRPMPCNTDGPARPTRWPFS